MLSMVSISSFSTEKSSSARGLAMGLTSSKADTAASRLAVLASASSLATMSVSPSAPPMVLSTVDSATDSEATVLSAAEEAAELAELPQPASRAAHSRIGSNFFMGRISFFISFS